MFVVHDKDLNINWEFKWEYRKMILGNSWATRAYVKFLDRNTRERGILSAGYYLDRDHVSKDEMRLNLLYKALDAVCNDSFYAKIRDVAVRTVLEKYAAVHSVPKQQTRLGTYQQKLIQDLENFSKTQF